MQRIIIIHTLQNCLLPELLKKKGFKDTIFADWVPVSTDLLIENGCSIIKRYIRMENDIRGKISGKH